MNILLSSYSFGAGRGSEAGVGWNVAKGLALRGHTVTVLTTSEFSTGNCSAIEQEELNITLIEEDCGISDFPEPGSYRKWQRRVRSFLRNLANTQAFDLIHHITLNQYRVCKEWGGNLLLNIAPRADGTVPEAYYKAVKEFGDAIKNM